MASPDDFKDELYSSIPGAPSDLIDQQLSRTIREFARRSGAWIVESKPVNIRAGRDTYSFKKIQQGEAVFTMHVSINGRPVRLFDAMPSHIDWVGTYAYCTDPGVVRIQPTPTEDMDDGLQVTVAYMPIYNATWFDDKFVSHWYEHIMDGVKARLLAMPGKPFSNPQLASFHESRFASGIAEARDEARRRFSMSETSWTYPRWA